MELYMREESAKRKQFPTRFVWRSPYSISQHRRCPPVAQRLEKTASHDGAHAQVAGLHRVLLCY